MMMLLVMVSWLGGVKAVWRRKWWLKKEKDVGDGDDDNDDAEYGDLARGCEGSVKKKVVIKTEKDDDDDGDDDNDDAEYGDLAWGCEGSMKKKAVIKKKKDDDAADDDYNNLVVWRWYYGR